MKNLRVSALLFCAMGLSGAALGQTWVSNGGNDANACTMAAPCKTFQRAINVTPAGGQVGVLNPGDYGGMTITQSIRIDGGGMASNSNSSITVNTPAGSVVQLRNLSIHGDTIANGIYFENAGSLDIDHVQVSGFGDCIVVIATGVSDVVIRDTSVENCGYVGYYMSGGTSGTLTAKLVNSHASLVAEMGLYIYSGSVAVYNSTFSSPGPPSASDATYGVYTYGVPVFLDNCEINGFYTGIVGYGAQVSRSSFINNATAFTGTVISNGNNAFYGNTANGTFSQTIPLR